MTPIPVRNSVTGEIKLIESITGLIAKVVTGLVFMGGGAWAVWYGIKNENHNLMVAGAVSAVFGAMILPSVFDAVKPVVVFFFPNGIPLIGGRRVSDPPAVTPPSSDPTNPIS